MSFSLTLALVPKSTQGRMVQGKGLGKDMGYHWRKRFACNASPDVHKELDRVLQGVCAERQGRLDAILTPAVGRCSRAQATNLSTPVV